MTDTASVGHIVDMVNNFRARMKENERLRAETERVLENAQRNERIMKGIWNGEYTEPCQVHDVLLKELNRTDKERIVLPRVLVEKIAEFFDTV